MNFIEPAPHPVMESLSYSPHHYTPRRRLHFPLPRRRRQALHLTRPGPSTLGTQRDTGRSFQHWLDQHGQTKNAVERFWKPILVSDSHHKTFIRLPSPRQLR